MNKYLRKIYPAAMGQPIEVDIYSILEAYDVTCPAIGHCIKKLLCAGVRGHKSKMDDLKEAVTALARALELEQIRENHHAEK